MKLPLGEPAVPLVKVLAIDPGREKCGVAVVTEHGEVLLRRIFRRAELIAALAPVVKQHAIEIIVLGDATSSKPLVAELTAAFPGAAIHLVDEAHSTLIARALYWRAHPPGGWRRFVPLSLQNPPVAIDDYAAVILAQRYLDKQP